MNGIGKLLDLLASLVTQVRAAMEVKVLFEGENRTDGSALRPDRLETSMWGDATGRITRNGLGSLEIGAGKTRVDE